VQTAHLDDLLAAILRICPDTAAGVLQDVGMLARSFAVVLVVIVAASCAAGPPKPATPSGYDAALAQRLGADEYGMAKYVVAFLKAGPKHDDDPEHAAQLMQAHLANIMRLAEQGSLVIAGPFLDDGPLRGIYIFKVATVEEARALTATDPAIQAGHLEMELHPWYGSAALAELPALHKRVQKKAITDR
jgi:uncharacterized protein YciI